MSGDLRLKDFETIAVIVIGERHRDKTRPGTGRGERGGRERAVRSRRMRMEINPHNYTPSQRNTVP